MEVILLERVAKLGQMGDTVRVKRRLCAQLPAAARQGPARHRRTTRSASRPQRAQLEARNLERRKEAEAVAEKLDGQSFIIIRQAGETGVLYGSVSTRDLAEIADGGRLHGRPRADRPQHADQDARPAHGAGRAAPGGRGEGDDQRRPQPRGGRAPGARRDASPTREETNLDDLGLEVGAALAEAGPGDERLSSFCDFVRDRSALWRAFRSEAQCLRPRRAAVDSCAHVEGGAHDQPCGIGDIAAG